MVVVVLELVLQHQAEVGELVTALHLAAGQEEMLLLIQVLAEALVLASLAMVSVVQVDLEL